MIPRELEERTRCFVAPTNWNAEQSGDCADLDIIDVKDGELNIMYSAWVPSMEEIAAMLRGAPIWLGIIGTVHPVVSVHVGEPEETVG